MGFGCGNLPPLSQASEQVRPHPPCADGEREGELGTKSTSHLDPIQLVWIGEQDCSPRESHSPIQTSWMGSDTETTLY
jgi:hypothetical protein